MYLSCKNKLIQFIWTNNLVAYVRKVRKEAICKQTMWAHFKNKFEEVTKTLNRTDHIISVLENLDTAQIFIFVMYYCFFKNRW